MGFRARRAELTPLLLARTGQDGHQDPLTCVASNQDGSLILTGSVDCHAKLVNSATGKVGVPVWGLLPSKAACGGHRWPAGGVPGQRNHHPPAAGGDWGLLGGLTGSPPPGGVRVQDGERGPQGPRRRGRGGRVQLGGVAGLLQRVSGGTRRGAGPGRPAGRAAGDLSYQAVVFPAGDLGLVAGSWSLTGVFQFQPRPAGRPLVASVLRGAFTPFLLCLLQLPVTPVPLSAGCRWPPWATWTARWLSTTFLHRP